MTGQTISHYRIVEKLGEGGMGVVYKAKDTNLDRTVALKFLAPHLLGNAEYKQRFLREAKAAASVDHPNICMVHEVGDVDGHVFLAMGYIDGPEVSAKIKERPLKLDDALDITIQAAKGLRAAHQQGIVHRDVKSSNLMLTPTGQVKIMDFGLAQLTDGSRLTKTDTIMGTPAYMSPEQAQRLPTDRRTDIWSLGVVLYEMVTGRLPFEGEREQAVLYSIINEPHEPVTAIRAGVPLELDRVLGKALAKNSEQRYQHLDDMLVDLRALRENPLTSSQLTAAAQPNRRKVLWVGGGIAVAALALAAGLNWDRFDGLGVGGTPRLASIAVLPLVNFSGDPEQEYFSDGMTEGLITELAKVGALKVISRTSVMRYKGIDKPLPEIARELGVDTVLEGSAQRVGDRVRITAQLIDAATDEHLWAETYDRGMSDVLRLQSELAREIARQINVTLTPEQESRLKTARQVNPDVYEAYVRGMFYVSQNTPEGFEKGLEYLHRAVEIDPAEPLAYAGLAEGYVTLGHGGGERLDVFPRAKAAAEQALKLDPGRAEAVAALAYVALYHEWDWAKAERLFQQALELNSSLAMTHYHYAWYLALFSRLDEAIAEHKLARDLDPLRPLHTAWLGGLYNFAGRHDEAITEARKAIELNPNFPPSYYVLRFAYSRKGMHEEAITAARRREEIVPARKNSLLGVAYAEAGRREEALKIADELDRSSGPGPFFFLAPQIYLALGEKEEALRLLELAYEAHFPFLPWIRVRGGEFDALRDDPRFQDLLRRMNLPL